MRKEYNWKALQLLVDIGIVVYAGMKEDWQWTCDKVTQEVIDKMEIAGISGSDWGTPTILLNGEYYPCYIEVG